MTIPRLGADRWVAMICVRQHVLRKGKPCPLVVVMVEAAVTVDIFDALENFLRGFILPCHGIVLRAFETGTEGLHVHHR